MKRKFEANVAVELPKTKLHEPDLPWKLEAEDFAEIDKKSDEYKSALAGTPPFKTRAIFPVMLVVVIFAVSAYIITGAVMDNEKMRSDAARRERDLATLQTDLNKTFGEKELLSKSQNQLEKKIGDLAAQKELFATIIESLAKKNDEPDLDKLE